MNETIFNAGNRSGSLDGIRVFDLTRILAGPSCTQILGDLGADVIKVERPDTGDDTRAFAPPFVPDANGDESNESAYFCGANRNKRSITLDIASLRGQSLARQLIGKSDILVENFKAGGLAQYGLSYEQLKSQFPELIYCSITGFGQTGPYAQRPGYDVLLQGMGGLMSITGEPSGEPMKTGVPVADLMAGMYACVAINAALHHRQRTGEGQHIDIGMLDVMVAFSSVMGMNYLATDELPIRMGNAHSNIVPYQSFATLDGTVILAVGNDDQFRRFASVAQCPELADDARFRTNADRLINRAELIPLVTEIMAGKTSDYWLEELEVAKVSCGPVYDFKQMFADPQVVARQMVVDMQHPATRGTPVRLLGSPIRLSKAPISYRRPPPMLGEHTEQILFELLGVESSELGDLRLEKVIGEKVV